MEPYEITQKAIAILEKCGSHKIYKETDDWVDDDGNWRRGETIEKELRRFQKDGLFLQIATRKDEPGHFSLETLTVPNVKDIKTVFWVKGIRRENIESFELVVDKLNSKLGRKINKFYQEACKKQN